MREIKFRAWNGNRMLFNAKDGYYDFIIEGGELSIFGEFDLRERKTPDYPLMQYTGLKDKNGKEIYEGDIVEASRGLFQIKWDDGFCGFSAFRQTDKSTTENAAVHPTMNPCEVIGNIYESPELLGEL